MSEPTDSQCAAKDAPPQWSEMELRAIDAWAAEQEDLPSRSDAIRRLVELGLRAKAK